MTSRVVYIGLGSNLAQPDQQIAQALQALKKIPTTELTAVSSLYASKPMGPQDQPDYMNAVAQLTTKLPALALLDQLQAIELDFGRVRKDERWGARVLDLDILLYDQEIISEPRLSVPHYGMKIREFVIYPLAELAPELHLPDGTSVLSLQKQLDANGLFVVGPLHI